MVPPKSSKNLAPAIPRFLALTFCHRLLNSFQVWGSIEVSIHVQEEDGLVVRQCSKPGLQGAGPQLEERRLMIDMVRRVQVELVEVVEACQVGVEHSYTHLQEIGDILAFNTVFLTTALNAKAPNLTP